MTFRAPTASSTVPKEANPSRNVSSVVCQARPLGEMIRSTSLQFEVERGYVPNEKLRHDDVRQEQVGKEERRNNQAPCDIQQVALLLGVLIEELQGRGRDV